MYHFEKQNLQSAYLCLWQSTGPKTHMDNLVLARDFKTWCSQLVERSISKEVITQSDWFFLLISRWNEVQNLKPSSFVWYVSKMAPETTKHYIPQNHRSNELIIKWLNNYNFFILNIPLSHAIDAFAGWKQA